MLRILGIGVVCTTVCANALALDPAVPPGGNFNLTHWYLGLPVDSSGGTSGDSASIPAAQLVAGYSNALYFYTGADGAMVCWAPVTGATTPGSSYPRSELREQISPPSNDINWSGYGTSILAAQCRVLQIPSTKKVIIGQIHTKTGAARPLVKLQFNDGVIEGLVKNSPDADPDTKFTFQHVGLGNPVNYTIRMENGLVTMTINGSSQSMNVFQSDPNWASQEFYFKAGSYCQDNAGTTTEGARVAFYALAATHGVTNTPPTFSSDPVTKPGATVNVAYNGSLAGDVMDPDAGEVLTFNKVSGPAWLSVAQNGALSGTPGAGDLGTNSWTVRVTDLASASHQATLNIFVSTALTGGSITNLIVDDSFTDGNRAATGPLQADWWSSSSASGNSIEASVGALGLVTGPSGRGIHGTFAPQMLGIGDSLIATCTFTTPATVGVNKSSAFKVALMDFNNPGLAADLTSSSSTPNPLYVGQPGYMADFDVNTGAAADVSIREHDQSSTLGRFLGTTTEWINDDNSADAGYAFVANTEYVGVFSITRTGADSVEVFSSIRQGGGLMDSHRRSYSGGIANHFGMLGFWANSDTFGSSNTAGNPDNGITFSNIKVEVVTAASVNAPTLDITLTGPNAVLSWPTNATAGFLLEAATSLGSLEWSGAGTPAVIGNRNYVTNTLTGNGKFYRLKKPQ